MQGKLNFICRTNFSGLVHAWKSPEQQIGQANQLSRLKEPAQNRDGAGSSNLFYPVLYPIDAFLIQGGLERFQFRYRSSRR